MLTSLVLDPQWVEAKLKSRAVRLPHVVLDDAIVLTASPKQLQRFIERHGNDAGAFVALKVALHAFE